MSLFQGTAEQIAAERAAIVAEALSWVGTPFHHAAGVKGAGCDCVHLLYRVGQARAFVPSGELPAYKPQWFQHRGEPLFLQGLKAAGAICVPRGSPGDIAMYNFGRHAAHGAILIDANSMVHAFSPVGCITRGDRREFAARFDSYWSVFPETL
jgi:cell wall-associated NlpC family hydrolase